MHTFDERLKGVKVLVVDDDGTSNHICAALLTKMGCCVGSAFDGEEALKMYKKGYDVILMDCYMPNMNGCEVTRAIRLAELQGVIKVLIIALTAAATDDVEEEIFKSGVDGFLPKPINPILLYEKLISLLGIS